MDALTAAARTSTPAESAGVRANDRATAAGMAGRSEVRLRMEAGRRPSSAAARVKATTAALKTTGGAAATAAAAAPTATTEAPRVLIDDHNADQAESHYRDAV